MDVPRFHDSEIHSATTESRCGELKRCDDASIVTCSSTVREQARRKFRRYVNMVVKARPTWSAGMRG